MSILILNIRCVFLQLLLTVSWKKVGKVLSFTPSSNARRWPNILISKYPSCIWAKLGIGAGDEDCQYGRWWGRCVSSGRRWKILRPAPSHSPSRCILTNTIIFCHKILMSQIVATSAIIFCPKISMRRIVAASAHWGAYCGASLEGDLSSGDQRNLLVFVNLVIII